MATLSTPKHFRHVQIKHALRLELKGLKHSQGSVYALAKREFNLSGSKAKVSSAVDGLVDTLECCVP